MMDNEYQNAYSEQEPHQAKASDNPLNSWYSDSAAAQQPQEIIGLSYGTLKAQENAKKAFKIAMISAACLFFLVLFLSMVVFGNDNYYTLKSYETLEKVSKKFNVPLNAILNLNNLQDKNSVMGGQRIKIPTAHDSHIVKEGETLYSIAKENGIKRYELANYNRLAGSKVLKPGDMISIPRLLSDIHITANEKTGLKPFTVKLNVSTITRDKVKSYKWDFGNGDKSDLRNPVYTYPQKGVFKVSLKVIDENNNEITSNTLTVNVRALANIHYEAPVFFEVNKGDIISLNAKAVDNLGDVIPFNYTCKINGYPKLLSQVGNTDKFIVMNTGWSRITIEAEGFTHTGFYFVSPIPSKESSRNDVNWYKTQYNTGNNGNCGPTSVAMAIQWAKGLDIPVRSVREITGTPVSNGGLSWEHLKRALDFYKVNYIYRVTYAPQDIFDAIDKDHIVLILFDRGRIEVAKGEYSRDLFGRYYTDAGGHYVVAKGYSLDKKYLVVYDPIPADWWQNSARYSDGVSMIGRNRYYSVNTLYSELKERAVLEILRN
jgi:PKD repeat protein